MMGRRTFLYTNRIIHLEDDHDDDGHQKTTTLNLENKEHFLLQKLSNIDLLVIPV